MFKRILVPTDGSALSEKAITEAVALAKALGASIYGIHVTPEILTTYGVSVDDPDRLPELMENEARAYLAAIENQAEAAGVRFQVFHTVDDYVYRAILSVADEHQCDLIFMSSHGRRGFAGLLLGSETQKVLTHARIPVLVYRDFSR